MSVLLAGVLVVVQLFVVRLSYSGRFMARASMRCDQPSLFAGLLAGFLAFGGLTRTSIFDNASTAVRRILRGRNRAENEAFTAFRGGLALHVEFAAPAKGNEKGGVEGVHGYIEDNFFRPMPSYADLDELNAAIALPSATAKYVCASAYDTSRDDRRSFRPRAADVAGVADGITACVCDKICKGQQVFRGLFRARLVFCSDTLGSSQRPHRSLRATVTHRGRYRGRCGTPAGQRKRRPFP